MSELSINVSERGGETPVTVLHLSGHLHGDTEHELMEHVQVHHLQQRFLHLH